MAVVKGGEGRGGYCGIESREMMFSGQDGPGAENESGPGRWSSEALLRAEKNKGASGFLPEQLELLG